KYFLYHPANTMENNISINQVGGVSCTFGRLSGNASGKNTPAARDGLRVGSGWPIASFISVFAACGFAGFSR
ncbi:hypothetical protein, partial [Sangeribacter muris]|uniref:hypothetical protein n=1 Tax=Sangeribacter muris TaxID=2880703 RepID=UPI00244D9B5A